MALASAKAEPPLEDPKVPVVDMETFEQILELDEEDSREFSSEMVWQYFSQAKLTFSDMDEALYVHHSPCAQAFTDVVLALSGVQNT